MISSLVKADYSLRVGEFTRSKEFDELLIILLQHNFTEPEATEILRKAFFHGYNRSKTITYANQIIKNQVRLGRPGSFSNYRRMECAFNKCISPGECRLSDKCCNG